MMEKESVKNAVPAIFLLTVFFILFSINVFGAQINSTNYKNNVVVSTGGENITSPSYKTTIATGIINGIIESRSYINKLGFFYTWLLADGQPCTSNSQCEGGYCCSSSCSSSSCPAPSPAPSGGGGAAGSGGGGGIIVPQEEETIINFDISPGSIKSHIALGTAKTETIKIKNTGNSEIGIGLDVITVNEFLFLSDSSFSLNPGEEKEFEANIIGKRLGSYLGTVTAKAKGISKSIDVIIEVESEQVLFDAKMYIPPAYKTVKPGSDLKAQITLLNVGPPRKVDVTTTYIIKDKRGNVIDESSETFAVETQTSFVKTFRIPKEMAPGDYLLVVELRYGKSFAVSSDIFRVLGEQSIIESVSETYLLMPLLIITITGIIILMGYLIISRANLRIPGRRKK
jgi:hypothetical protein